MAKIQRLGRLSGLGLFFIDRKHNSFGNIGFFCLFLKRRFRLNSLLFSLLFFQSVLSLFVPRLLLTDNLLLFIEQLGLSLLSFSEIMFIKVDQGVLRFLFEEFNKVSLGLLDGKDVFVLW